MTENGLDSAVAGVGLYPDVGETSAQLSFLFLILHREGFLIFKLKTKRASKAQKTIFHVLALFMHENAESDSQVLNTMCRNYITFQGWQRTSKTEMTSERIDKHLNYTT